MDWEFNKVFHIDSDKALPNLLSTKIRFDLILTDPPYNLNKDFGNASDKLTLPEFLKVTRDRISMCKELLTHDGSIVWFGIHHYIGLIQAIMYDVGLFYRRLNIWHYENGFSRTTRSPLTHYEPFLWFSKSNNKWVYNTNDVRIPYKSTERLKNPIYYKNSKGVRKVWVPNPHGALRGDVWKFPTLAGSRFKKEKTPHPTQKPESLFLELVKAFCPKDSSGHYNGKILDPFHGVGTLGVVCEKLNQKGHKIKWLGFEIEKRWVDISNQRLKKLI